MNFGAIGMAAATFVGLSAVALLILAMFGPAVSYDSPLLEITLFSTLTGAGYVASSYANDLFLKHGVITGFVLGGILTTSFWLLDTGPVPEIDPNRFFYAKLLLLGVVACSLGGAIHVYGKRFSNRK